MWSDILTGYGIFILEILTILLVIAAIVAMIIQQDSVMQHIMVNWS